jgi:RHS repeat-associated protein
VPILQTKTNKRSLTTDNTSTGNYLLYRGYTGHEHLDEFALINMNGRMYDPVIGRMLSPDNYVQGGSNGFNRYAYVHNNPLKYTDPNGEFVVPLIIIAALVLTEPGYQMQKVFSPVAVHVSINFGSEKRGVGIEASVGLPQALPVSYRVHGGIAYNWKNYNVGKGWETQRGSEWGLAIGPSFGVSYSTTKYNSPGTEFDQTTGKFTIWGAGGAASLQYENDWWPDFLNKLPLMYDADHGDRYRTAAMRLNVGLITVDFNLFTGDPEDENGYRSIDKFTGNKTGTYDGGTADKYRAGVVYVGFGPLKIGRNSEKNRHAIQNRFAHDFMMGGDSPYFRVDKSKKSTWYFNIGSGSGNTLW